ncbi:MAG: hypothetical protein ACUVXA_01590 [Candidatus Jordarchaeum sp.]|uniref:hypothetical protein n=1 Tax=Candidatus Jordarchaeum sp. TaxID=2823881 RepID=UPI00404B651F
MSEKYLSAPDNKDMDSFNAMVVNVGEDLQDAARSAADSVSSRLKVGDFKGASEYVFDMVIQSIMINLREPPRKAIDILKSKSDQFSQLLENPVFQASEKLLESFEKGDKKQFAEAMQTIEDSVIGKTSIDFRYGILKDLHCAFYKYNKP